MKNRPRPPHDLLIVQRARRDQIPITTQQIGARRLIPDRLWISKIGPRREGPRIRERPRLLLVKRPREAGAPHGSDAPEGHRERPRDERRDRHPLSINWVKHTNAVAYRHKSGRQARRALVMTEPIHERASRDHRRERLGLRHRLGDQRRSELRERPREALDVARRVRLPMPKERHDPPITLDRKYHPAKLMSRRIRIDPHRSPQTPSRPAIRRRDLEPARAIAREAVHHRLRRRRRP